MQTVAMIVVVGCSGSGSGGGCIGVYCTTYRFSAPLADVGTAGSREYGPHVRSSVYTIVPDCRTTLRESPGSLLPPLK